MDVLVAQLLFLGLLLTGVHCSRKKGMGVAPKEFQCDDFVAMDNIHWWYDWGANFDFIESQSNCNITAMGTDVVDSYVAMVWGYRDSWDPRVREVDHSEGYVLGFNEPNHIHQADLTPQEAADLWPIIEQNAGNRKIVGPAAAHCGADCVLSSEIDWFDQFFAILCVNETVNGEQPKSCRMDYIATHIYTCKVAKILRKLQELYDRYGLKIWLTEFACPNPASAAEQLVFMTQVLPELEQADHVFRYAWYVSRTLAGSTEFVTSEINILATGSSTLTTLGDYYNSYTYTDYPPTTTTTTTTTSTTSTTSTTTSTTSSTTSLSTSLSTSSSTSSSASPGSSTTTSGTNITTVGSNARRIISTNTDIAFMICLHVMMLILHCVTKG